MLCAGAGMPEAPGILTARRHLKGVGAEMQTLDGSPSLCRGPGPGWQRRSSYWQYVRRGLVFRVAGEPELAPRSGAQQPHQHCRAVAVVLLGLAVSLPRHCCAVSAVLPRLCRVFAFAVPLPWFCTVLQRFAFAVVLPCLLPCPCRVVAVSLPWLCVFAVVLPWLCHAMLLPRCCHCFVVVLT